jgi:hypothetical protein
VRNNFQFIGTNGTVLTQSSASTAPFVLPTTGALVADNVRLKDFSLQAAAGSSTDGISMVAALNGGLFYSSFENITIGSVTPFGRNQLRFDSSASGAPLSTTDQFIWVERVFAFRGTNGPPALRITGPYSGQMTFQTCQFDGVGASGPDTSAHNNIQIDDGNTTSGEWLPYSIKFINLTSQNASHSGGAAIFLNGVESVDVDEGHFENDNGVIIETQSSYHGNSAHIHDSYFATTAVNGGSGFIATMDAGSKLTFNDNTFNATPDQFYIGSSTAFVSAKDNWNASNNSWLAVNVSKFLTQFQVYTCAAGANQLPSASTAGAGATAIVSDANSYTPGTCTGGGSDYMIAVSNGSVWTVH